MNRDESMLKVEMNVDGSMVLCDEKPVILH